MTFNLIIYTYLNKYRNMSFITKFKGALFEALKDNKKLIIVLYILFIICFIGAWIFSATPVSTAMSNMNATNMGETGNFGASAVELFIHNEMGGIVTYITSILFGIPAVLFLIYNGVNLGMMGQLFSQLLPNGGLYYIVYLIPHGIFEITATVIESVAGIVLFSFIWNFIKTKRSNETQGFSESFEKTKNILIQSIILMIFSTILLVIAALIEAYFSVPFADLIIGI